MFPASVKFQRFMSSSCGRYSRSDSNKPARRSTSVSLTFLLAVEQYSACLSEVQTSPPGHPCGYSKR